MRYAIKVTMKFALVTYTAIRIVAERDRPINFAQLESRCRDLAPHDPGCFKSLDVTVRDANYFGLTVHKHWVLSYMLTNEEA